MNQVQPDVVTPLQSSQAESYPAYPQSPSRSSVPAQPTPTRQQTDYGDWMAPAAAGVGAGVLGSEAYRRHNAREPTVEENDTQEPIPEENTSREPIYEENYNNEPRFNPTTGNSVPVMTTTNTVPHSTMHLPVTEPIPAAEEMPRRNMPVRESVPTPAPQMLPTSNTGASNAGVFNENRGVSGALSNPGSVSYGIDGLGGLERKGARETGAIFPSVVRHNTDMSISQLHVPGEFPVSSGRVQPSTTVQGDFVPPSHWDLARE